MNNMLEVKNLCKKYGRFALQDVSFAVPKGYIMGFIGPNGAGKTTTMKAILNMINADSGSVSVLDKKKQPWEQKEEIGVVMDLPFYVDEWKVRDVEKAVSPFYLQWNHHEFKTYLERFDLHEQKKVKELSRGMKVKLMLAIALSHNAKLLVLDEPTSGLDPVARDELIEILGEFMEDETRGILFSTHITSDLERIADYITYIRNGRIEFSGEKEDLMERYVLIKGGSSDLTPEQKRKVLGYREHSVGFEGMLPAEELKYFPAGIAKQKVTLDEIVIFLNKEGRSHE